MKNYLKLYASILAAAFLFTGCSSQANLTNAAYRIRANRAQHLSLLHSSSREDEAEPVSSITSKQAVAPLAQFSTEFKGASGGRANNIQNASVAIDQKIIQPGETFSFNEAVGPTTKGNGYQIATVFDKGRETKGYGGGVCQVSSTLFNAADMAGLEITERHPHSKEVSYVPEGRDAATSYGSSDLKFVNTLGYPVKINSYIMNETLTVEILKA